MTQYGMHHIRRPIAEGPLFSAAVELTDLPRRRHDSFNGEWLLLYALSPTSIRLHSVRRHVRIPLPGAVLVPPFMRYVIDTRPAPGRGHHLFLKALWLDTVCVGLAPDPASSLWLFTDPAGQLRELMKAAVEAACNVGERAYWGVQHVGQQVFTILRNARADAPGHFRIEADSTSPATRALVARVLTYLSTHLTESFTIRDLAQDAHVSPSTLAHTYKTATGETPMNALRRLRLDYARQLLVSDMKLDTVAEAAGFYNANHLARAFTRREGVTPGGFRRQFATAPEQPVQRHAAHAPT